MADSGVDEPETRVEGRSRAEQIGHGQAALANPAGYAAVAAVAHVAREG